MGLQFALGVIVLRWRTGYLAVKFITDQMNQFLSYSMAGAAMAFGDPWFFLHPFAFLVRSHFILAEPGMYVLIKVGCKCYSITNQVNDY